MHIDYVITRGFSATARATSWAAMSRHSTHKRQRSAMRADRLRGAPGGPGRVRHSDFAWEAGTRAALGDAIHTHPFNHAVREKTDISFISLCRRRQALITCKQRWRMLLMRQGRVRAGHIYP